MTISYVQHGIVGDFVNEGECMTSAVGAAIKTGSGEVIDHGGISFNHRALLNSGKQLSALLQYHTHVSDAARPDLLLQSHYRITVLVHLF